MLQTLTYKVSVLIIGSASPRYYTYKRTMTIKGL